MSKHVFQLEAKVEIFLLRENFQTQPFKVWKEQSFLKTNIAYLNCLFQQYIVGHDQFYSFQFKFNFPFQFINFNKKYKSICVNQFVHVIFKYSGKYKKQQHIFNPFKPPPSKEITYEKTPRTLSKGCKRNVNDSQKCCL